MKLPLGRRGSIALMAALLSLPLLAALGVGIDLARAFLVHSRLLTAIDSAALAGARSITSAGVVTEAKGYFWANFDRVSASSNIGYMNALVRVLEVGVTSNQVTVEARAELPTSGFLKLIGIDTIPLRVSNAARRGGNGIELALVLDTTGSMGAANMAALREAATSLVEIVFGREETIPNLWVSVVPYTASINIGPGRTDWLLGGSLDQSRYLNRAWAGCVEARHQNGNDENDATPAMAPFRPFRYPSTLGVYPVAGDNDWASNTITEQDQIRLPENTARGPNLGCGLSILPLNASKTQIRAKIAELVQVYRGGTTINLGMQGGWFTLSPRWRGLWGGDARLPLDYRQPNARKVLVLMTDGNNEWYDYPNGAPGLSSSAPNNANHSRFAETVDADVTGYGRLSENRLGIVMPAGGTVAQRRTNTIQAMRNELDARTTRLCTRIKDAGITVYTITFNLNTASTQALFRNCASRPEYWFNSPDQAALLGAFRTIGEQLAQIRLVR